MQRIDNATAKGILDAPASAGTPGYFTDGNPALGQAATILPAEFMNLLMLELLAPVLAAGLTPSKSAYTQLLGGLAGLWGAQAVKSATTTAPPGSPAAGDVYLVPAGASGAWSGKADQVAIYTPLPSGAGWVFAAPRNGQLALAADTAKLWRYSAGAWIAAMATSAEHVAGSSSSLFANPAGIAAVIAAFIHAMTANAAPVGSEEIAAYDVVAGANRKITLSNIAAFVGLDQSADAFFYGML